MKINYLFKNTGSFLLATGLLVTTLLSSCLKDNSPGTINFGNSPALLSFQYAGTTPTPYIAAILPNPNLVYSSLEVTLSVPSVTLGSAVTVTLSEDAAGEQAYIAADTVGQRVDHVLPTSQYSVAKTITIPAGTQTVKVPITFDANQIDFTQNYILGFKLTAPNGAIIASNLANAIVVIELKSKFQALYTVTGSFTDNTSATTDITDMGIYPIAKAQLQTVTANTLDYYDPKSYGGNSGYYQGINSGGANSVYGSFAPVFTFDLSTNVVTGVTNYYGQNSGSHVRSAVLDPAVTPTSSGTPGTPGFTFTVGFIMEQSGSPRTYFNETFTYAGPL